MFGPDLDFADRRTRAQSVKKKMFVPKKFIGVEDDTKKEFKEIKETVKRESIRKKSLNNNSNIINTLAALKVDFIKIDTDEDKLKKMEKERYKTEDNIEFSEFKIHCQSAFLKIGLVSLIIGLLF